jgi:hypothetical protein
MKMDSKKAGIKDYLDRTFGENGLKTDIKITLTRETVFTFIGMVVGAVAFGSLTFYFIKGIMQPKPIHHA